MHQRWCRMQVVHAPDDEGMHACSQTDEQQSSALRFYCRQILREGTTLLLKT